MFFRSLFGSLIILPVSATGLIINRKYLHPNQVKFLFQTRTLIDERNIAKWNFLSSWMYFYDMGTSSTDAQSNAEGEKKMFDENEIEEGESEFFGIEKVKKEANTNKITLSDGDKVQELADKLRKKCHESISKWKLDLMFRNDEAFKKEIRWIKKRCYENPEKREDFRRLRNFFEWEYNNDKRIFIVEPKVEDDPWSQKQTSGGSGSSGAAPGVPGTGGVPGAGTPAAAPPAATTTPDNTTLVGYFLVNLMVHNLTIKALNSTVNLEEATDTNPTPSGTLQAELQERFFWSFQFLSGSDFQACILDKNAPSKSQDHYWLTYSEDMKNPTQAKTGQTNPSYCSSMKVDKQWISYWKRDKDESKTFTHYKIAKNYDEIKEYLKSKTEENNKKAEEKAKKKAAKATENPS